VGLGNPGYQYELTPHNLGFRVVDHLAQDCGVEIDRPEAQALTAVVRVEGVDVVLAKPQTFMNLSGLAVARLLGNYDLPVEDMIVLVDDADLPLGSLRIRRRGTAGRHNGLNLLIVLCLSSKGMLLLPGVTPSKAQGQIKAIKFAADPMIVPFGSEENTTRHNQIAGRCPRKLYSKPLKKIMRGQPARPTCSLGTWASKLLGLRQCVLACARGSHGSN